MAFTGFDVLVLTVSVLERDACLKHLTNVKRGVLRTHLDDDIEMISVRAGFFGDLSVVVLCVLKPDGNRVSAMLTLAALRFSPAILVSIGVGGGVIGEMGSVEVGDVVISNAIADHTQSVEQGERITYSIRSQKVCAELQPALLEISKNSRWIERRQSPNVELAGALSSRIIIAAISAGNVLAMGSTGPLALAIKEQAPDVRAVDMESAAASTVARSMGLPFVAVRGISDLRDGKGPDFDWWTQPWAMANATAAGFHLLANLSAFILNSKADLIPKIRFAEKHVDKSSVEATRENVETFARRLLQVNSPPSLANVFPKCRISAKQAFDLCLSLERSISERTENQKIESRSLTELLDRPELAHLVIGPPGSGKSHLFWNVAQKLLNGGQVIPLYLRLGKFQTWEGVKLAIRKVSQGLSLTDLTTDPRICFFLDGWSEFSAEASSLEKAKLLDELSRSRIIANGKVAHDSDSCLKIWELNALSLEQVEFVLKKADPQLPSFSREMNSLLQLPLFLSIHVLSNGTESEIGAVLHRFHDGVTQDLPSSFTEVLAEGAAKLTLADNNSYDRLGAVLRQLSRDKGLSDYSEQLLKLGTIVDSEGILLPIHELYWDWLAGKGVLANGLEEQALQSTKARAGVTLAIQSGEYSKLEDKTKIREKDIVFAAILESAWSSSPIPAEFKKSVDKLLSDKRLAFRHRGGLAALHCRRSEYLLPALAVLDAMVQARIFSQQWRDAISPASFLSNLSTVEDWFQNPGAEFFWDEVAAKGGSEWLPALQDLMFRGKLDLITACATALAVSPTVPMWVRAGLNQLLSEQPWRLRACASRRSNVQLAHIIADDYEKLVRVAQTKSGGGFCDLNKILVTCGDAQTFTSLLSRWNSFDDKTREWLGYAITDRGEPWISRFQKLGSVPHSLEKNTPRDIDDWTARDWIASGRAEAGWRALIARYGAEVMPEVLAALPTSFSGIDHVPALDCIRYCGDTPASVIPAIMSRLGSPMMPKAMEECLAALASVYPEGMPVIANFVVQGNSLHGYHLAQIMDLYLLWNQKSGIALAVTSPDGQSVGFSEWLANYAYERKWEDHFTGKIISKVPSVAVKLILGPLRGEPKKTEQIIGGLKNLRTADSALLAHMLSQPALAAQIVNVFSNCFRDFSSDEIEECLNCPSVNQHLLLSKLTTSSSPKHRNAHQKLISSLLEQPMDIHKYRYVARMLRCYSESTLFDFLHSLKIKNENWFWLVREVEIARGEFLLDENGELRK